MITFLEYVNKEQRKISKNLAVIQKVLTKEGFEVIDFLEEEDPYLYVKNANQDTEFEGIRIYRIGNDICYRVQNEEKTHPYGKAYILDVESVFEDLIADEDYDKKKAGEEVVEYITNEIRKFFARSAEAENEVDSEKIDVQRDPISFKVNGNDYANTIGSTGLWKGN